MRSHVHGAVRAVGLRSVIGNVFSRFDAKYPAKPNEHVAKQSVQDRLADQERRLEALKAEVQVMRREVDRMEDDA